MSTTVTVPVVPFDPELGAALAKIPLPGFITVDMVQGIRQQGFMGTGTIISAECVLANAPAPATTRSRYIVLADGGEIVLSIFTPKGAEQSPSARLCIYYIHGGGMLFGDRFSGASEALNWAADSGAVVASVEYRLAPEHPDPAPVEDWLRRAALGRRARCGARRGPRARMLVAGHSAGGGVALLSARDRDGPALCGQLLVYPMLDDRMRTAAHGQYTAGGLWNRQSDVTGWTALLGARRGGADVLRRGARPT